MPPIQFAVKGLLIRDGQFLAVHKTAVKSPKFELPGGRMNFGETAEETLRREMLEETGLHVTPLKLVDTWNYVTKSHQVTGIIYLCTAQSGNVVQLSGEHDTYEWLAAQPESFEKMNRLFAPQMSRWDWGELIYRGRLT